MEIASRAHLCCSILHFLSIFALVCPSSLWEAGRNLDVSSAWATQGNSEFPVNRNVDVFGLRAEKKKKTIDPSSEAWLKLLANILLTTVPSCIKDGFAPAVIDQQPLLVSGFQKVYLFGTLNDETLQVRASPSLLYELPPIEHCWQELLSLVLICMHGNLFHLKGRHGPLRGLYIIGKHLQLWWTLPAYLKRNRFLLTDKETF